MSDEQTERRPQGPQAEQRPRPIKARVILTKWPVWAFPAVLVTVVMFVLAVAYTGGIADPQASVHRLPIALINQDAGPVGAQFIHGIASAPDPDHKVSWMIMTRAEAQDRFDSGRLYGAIDVPPQFTSSLQSIGTSTPATSSAVVVPHVTLLTNQAAGSLASSLANTIEQTAIHKASQRLGSELEMRLRASGVQPTPAQLILLSDPVATTNVPGHALAARTGLGLSAFYIGLLIILSGFLGANIISSGVDSALGYAPSELGPRRRVRPVVPINRVQTLIIKMVMSIVLSGVTAGIIVLATAVVIRLDLPHLFQLWLFATCASVAVGIGVQAINAIFGGLGQLVSTIFFIALAVPSAGATIPLEAVPGFYRTIALFEPLRQISGGVRAIIYFDARANAGLGRAWILIAIGSAIGLVLGFGIAMWYDHRGFERIHELDVKPQARPDPTK